MSIIGIAIRSIMQRGVASALTVLSMVLGVMLVVIVLSLHGLVADSFERNSSVGYNMVIGARGGSMQLALNSVFYLSKPLETIPYDYYLAFQDEQTRAKDIQDSYSYRAREASWNALEMQTLGSPMPGFSPIAEFAHRAAAETMREKEQEQMGMVGGGRYATQAEYAIPICLGDWFGEFRVVATTEDFVEKVAINNETQEKLTFREGRNFRSFSEENGFYECIVGSLVALRSGVNVGDKINPSHSAPDGKKHEEGFLVVGILDESRTPNDRAVFINIEGFYLMENHSKPINESYQPPIDLDLPAPVGGPQPVDQAGAWDDEADAGQESGDANDESSGQGEDFDDAAFLQMATGEPDPNSNPGTLSDTEDHEHGPAHNYSDVIYQERLPLEQREITSILLRASGFSDEEIAQADPEEQPFMRLAGAATAMELETRIEEGDLESLVEWSPFRPNQAQKSAQAITPVQEVRTLLDVFVAPVQLVLLAVTVMICIVAGLSILVSIYNSMNERKSEIAVMRALGARRNTVLSIILIETFLLSTSGGLIGWTLAHGSNILISPYLEQHTGISVGFFDFAPAVDILSIVGVNGVMLTPELALIPGLILLSMVVGIYPALTAYRTDVAKALAS